MYSMIFDGTFVQKRTMKRGNKTFMVTYLAVLLYHKLFASNRKAVANQFYKLSNSNN